MVYSAEARERQQGNAWNQIEAPRHVGREERNLNQSSAVGSILTLVSARKKTSPLRVITA